jgi:hypothetical protein
VVRFRNDVAVAVAVVPRSVIVSVPAFWAVPVFATIGALEAVIPLPVEGPTSGALAIVTADAAAHPLPAGELTSIAPCAAVVATCVPVRVTVRADLTLDATVVVVVSAIVRTLCVLAVIEARHVTSADRVVAQVGAVVSKVAVPPAVGAAMSRATVDPVTAVMFAPSVTVIVFDSVVLVAVEGTAVAVWAVSTFVDVVPVFAPATPAVTPITPAVMPMPSRAAALTRRSLCVRCLEHRE